MFRHLELMTTCSPNHANAVPGQKSISLTANRVTYSISQYSCTVDIGHVW